MGVNKENAEKNEMKAKGESKVTTKNLSLIKCTIELIANYNRTTDRIDR